jgi:hypothetical protein
MSDTDLRASTQLGADPPANTDDIQTEQYTVSSFMFSNGDTDSFLTVMFCGLRMYIDIFAINLQKSAKRLHEYIHFLKVADAYEMNGQTVEDFYDWVLEGCSSTFSQVARPDLPTTPTLADYLYAVTRFYSLHANELDELGLVEITENPGKRMRTGTQAHEDSCRPWPSFTPSQVTICADNPIHALQHAPHKVRVAGCQSLLFFKPYEWSDKKIARHELDVYAQIRQASVSHLRTSTLFGLVRDESGLLSGLLLYYIDCDATTLQCAVGPEVSLSTRQYWAAEISETLTSPHEAGIVWGDAKAANILVDAHNDPWIIDFGGSYTPGWVEKDLAGTIEGDNQGLLNIVNYIFE